MIQIPNISRLSIQVVTLCSLDRGQHLMGLPMKLLLTAMLGAVVLCMYRVAQ